MEHMTAEQAAKAAEGLTFEIVWAALMESRERMEKSQQENDRQMKQMQKETAKLLKELSKNIGGVNNSIGQIIETMFSAELYKKFKKIGFEFTRQAECVKYTEGDRVIAEVDLLLENGDYIMLVEIKTKLSVDNIDLHLKRIDTVRGYMDTRGDSRIIIGAMAGGSVTKKMLEYAHRQGLYVVVQSGEAIAIADVPPGFIAREWVRG